MKYCSIDRMNDFEFHDSLFTFVSWDNNKLVVSAKCLNVHKDAAPNNLNSDMEISLARITFEGICINEFEPGRRWQTDENGNYYTNDPLVIYKSQKAQTMFEDELRSGITVMGIVFENNEYELGACGNDPYFSIRFTFSSVRVEWDDYSKKAWYELHRQYNRTVNLTTNDGEITTELIIVCHDENVYSFGGNVVESPSVSIGLKYGKVEYWGYGKDYLWADAFANLQQKLPRDVRIKCCMTCQHGNMCPVGNNPDELFCTRDVLITTKSDLFFYTEDESERERRSRKSTDICESFAEQSEDYYTYNDYLYFLNR